MANEALMHCYLQISKDNLEYKNTPVTFNADITTAKGPSPGAFTAATAGNGTQISFTNLSTPALAVIKNLDDTNYIEVGNVVSGTFYPFLEVLAGEFYIVRFSNNMSKTIWYIRANTADCEVSVEGFEA
jgi:hypothetical protein